MVCMKPFVFFVATYTEYVFPKGSFFPNMLKPSSFSMNDTVFALVLYSNRREMAYRVTTGQEMVREFSFDSRKMDIFMKSEERLS